MSAVDPPRAEETYRPWATGELAWETGVVRLTDDGGGAATRARLLVRAGGRSVALVELDPVPEPAAARAAVPPDVAARADELAASPRDYAQSGTWPPVTAVICTVGTHPRLAAAVRSVLAQDVPGLEVVVVDNAPATGATRAALDGLVDHRLRIVEEPRRGLAHARNRALEVARGEVVAFTDDDALAADSWLPGLLDVFRSDPAGQVVAVTGLVVAGQMASPAQEHFEEYGGFGKGMERQAWAVDTTNLHEGLGRPASHGPLFPWTTGKVGSGNSMAFRRDALERVGGFDVRLGAGTRTYGGEDLDAFSRLLVAGGVVVYTPDSVVWHFHREHLEELHTQLYGNGCGMGAILTKWLLRRPTFALRLVARLPVMAWTVLSPGSQRNAGRSPQYPGSLHTAELRGLAAGPWAYLRSLRTGRDP
ncbi:glycosyltransferase family 2 protein [Cellulomonas xiejunii]|uniref:glycosyltransferase family 2 protein n=1 Tax=Cellulomonas xiejunii TaxID=2968083 RepID=UPI001D0E5DD3|nr:glycosyltransferase [Cellulomonas xiejunii]